MSAKRTLRWMSAAALLAAQTGAAAACGFDAPLGNTFTPMHPKSLAVAFAVRDAVMSGTIEAADDPRSAGHAGYWRAVGLLKILQHALSAGHTESPAAVSVLFIELLGLWARLTPAVNGFAMDVHTEGANPGDVVIVTNEQVLTSILGKHLPIMTRSRPRGLIAVDGEIAMVEVTRRQLMSALDVQALCYIGRSFTAYSNVSSGYGNSCGATVMPANGT